MEGIIPLLIMLFILYVYNEINRKNGVDTVGIYIKCKEVDNDPLYYKIYKNVNRRKCRNCGCRYPFKGQKKYEGLLDKKLEYDSVFSTAGKVDIFEKNVFQIRNRLRREHKKIYPMEYSGRFWKERCRKCKKEFLIAEKQIIPDGNPGTGI